MFMVNQISFQILFQIIEKSYQNLPTYIRYRVPSDKIEKSLIFLKTIFFKITFHIQVRIQFL